MSGTFYDDPEAFYDDEFEYDAPLALERNRLMAKAIKNTKNLTSAQLANKVKLSTTAIGDNPVMFPNATDMLTDGNARIAALVASDMEVVAMEALLKLARDNRNTKHDELDQWYETVLIPFVSNIAQGASNVFLTAMLDLAEPPGPAPAMTKVSNLVFEPGGDDGTAALSFKRGAGVRVYEVQTSGNPMDPSTWQTYDLVSTSTLTLVGLPSAAKRWVRVRAIGSAGKKGPWSDPACCTVP